MTVFVLVQIVARSSAQLEACKGFLTGNAEDRFRLGNKRMVLIHKEEAWANALAKCEQLGMRLVTPATADENRQLGLYLNTRIKGDLPSLGWSYWNLWIALNDNKKDGDFVWATSQEPVTHSTWASNEPNGGTVENCVEISWANDNGLFWNDVNCIAKRRFICEVEELGLQ